MNNKKILILTPSAQEFGLGLFYEQAFLELGFRTLRLGVSPVVSRDKFKNRILAKFFSTALRVEKLADVYFQGLLKRAQKFSPNIIIVIRCETLTGEQVSALRRISSDGVFNIYPDSPLAIPSIKNLRTKDSIPKFSGIFTFAQALVPVFYQLGATTVYYLPFGFDSRTHRPQPAVGRSAKVGYFGTWGDGQEYWLRRVMPFGLAVYGEGWGRLSYTDPLRRAWTPTTGTRCDFASKIASVDIVFNMVRAEHGCGHSMKTFEIPACGGFQMTNRTEEQLRFFKEGVDSEYFDSVEELTSKLEFYIRNPISAERIARAGLVASAPHSYVSRAKTLEKLFFGGVFDGHDAGGVGIDR